MRANKRNARVMVYEVLVGSDAGSPFGSSALCTSQANLAETLSIKARLTCITCITSLCASAPRVLTRVQMHLSYLGHGHL